MAEYINKDTARRIINSPRNREQMVAMLEAVPSEDVQPVQRGHWQEAKTRTYGIYECDVCKGWTYIPNKPRDYKFCPRCGARMDGE